MKQGMEIRISYLFELSESELEWTGFPLFCLLCLRIRMDYFKLISCPKLTIFIFIIIYYNNCDYYHLKIIIIINNNYKNKNNNNKNNITIFN